jgi:hypothetical protein
VAAPGASLGEGLALALSQGVNLSLSAHYCANIHDVHRLCQGGRLQGGLCCFWGSCALFAMHKDMQEALLAGVTGTPAFFINGRLVSGAQPLESFVRVIEEELAR